ncbi:uncharacterized protein K452DRAFT_266868, partial [Aplosporella prunicola CBS 121167]
AAAEIAASEAWYSIATVEKAGFETELRFAPDTARRYLRVVALDKQGRVLGASQPGSSRFDVINTTASFLTDSAGAGAGPFAFLLGAAALCSLVVGVVCAAFARARRRDDAAYRRLVDEEAKDEVLVDDVCVDRRLYDVEDEEARNGAGVGRA